MELQRTMYVSMKMSHRSPRNRMEGSNYEDKCGQQANDVERMSNCKKRKISQIGRASCRERVCLAV